MLAGCAARLEPHADPTPPPIVQLPVGPVPPAYQYLFGSGEGAAEALTAMHALIGYATDKAVHRPQDSVVLAAGSPLTKGSFVPCGDKPLAVVFDADETLIYNLGFEARAAVGEAYDTARWERWERTGAVVAVPGAAHVIEDLRKIGVTPVVNSNRSAANAAYTAAALKAAGLGDFRPGETLFLKGDVDGQGGKDGRRQAIAARFCVIAMAGDQLGDFADAFNDPKRSVADRRQIAVHGTAAGKWGKGWFLLPNPVYGTALRGNVEDMVPANKRWADPAEEKN